MPLKNDDNQNQEPKEKYVVGENEYQKWLKVMGNTFRMQSGQVIADMASRMVRTLSYSGTPRQMSKEEYELRLDRTGAALRRFGMSIDRTNVFFGGPKWSGGKDKYGRDLRDNK